MGVLCLLAAGLVAALALSVARSAWEELVYGAGWSAAALELLWALFFAMIALGLAVAGLQGVVVT